MKEEDYKLLFHNCDDNAREWMRAGGIDIDAGTSIRPNTIYNDTVKSFQFLQWKRLRGARDGDLGTIWSEINGDNYKKTYNSQCSVQDTMTVIHFSLCFMR